MDSLALMTMIYLGCLYAAWVLLPLVPAVLTFWLFPNSSVAVSGPLANLTVNATGAFAAYLIVFVFTYPLVQSAKDTIGGFQRQFWTVRAQIKLVGADGRELRSDDLIRKLKVKPPAFSIDSYHATLKVIEDDGQLPFRLIVEIPEFGEEVIDLRSLQAGATTNYFKKTIELKDPIHIRQPSLGGEARPTIVVQPRTERTSTESSDQPR